MGMTESRFRRVLGEERKQAMNKLLVYGAIALLGSGVQAGLKLWEKRERRRRMDPANWSAEDLARVVALKKLEIDRDREVAAAYMEAMGLFDGGSRPRAVRS